METNEAPVALIIAALIAALQRQGVLSIDGVVTELKAFENSPGAGSEIVDSARLALKLLEALRRDVPHTYVR